MKHQRDLFRRRWNLHAERHHIVCQALCIKLVLEPTHLITHVVGHLLGDENWTCDKGSCETRLLAQQGRQHIRVDIELLSSHFAQFGQVLPYQDCAALGEGLLHELRVDQFQGPMGEREPMDEQELVLFFNTTLKHPHCKVFSMGVNSGLWTFRATLLLDSSSHIWLIPRPPSLEEYRRIHVGGHQACADDILVLEV